MKKRVLLIDNDPDLLETWAPILEREGYEVLCAGSAEEAEAVLSERWVHVMIVDIRLRSNTDSRDASGLSLAQKPLYHRIPKIMFTNWPSFEHVRTALGLPVEGLPPAVDYISKREGKEKLLAAIEHAFDQHIKLNHELEINFDEQSHLSILHLADLIEPGLEHSQLSQRAEELEGLFRMCFRSEHLLRIGRMAWRDEGRVALRVFAFADRQPPASFVLVCGRAALVTEETKQFSKFSAGSSTLERTQLKRNEATLHLGGNVYALAGADLESDATLTELYRSGTEKEFQKALESIFCETLGPCNDRRFQAEEWETLIELAQDRFGFTESIAGPAVFEERVRALAAKAPLHNVKIELRDDWLRFQLGGHSVQFPNPVHALNREFEFPVLVNTPVICSGDRVLTSDAGAWATDFARIGPTPLFWNFTAIEAMIRFDWVDSAKPQRMIELEQCLAAGFELLNMSELEPSLRSAARAIQSIRKLAGEVLGHDHAIYDWGLLYEAMRRFSEFDAEAPMTAAQRLRFIHCLMAAGVIAGRLALPSGRRKTASGGLRIEKESRTIIIGDQRLNIRGQGYDILCLLYDRPNERRTPREIIEQVYQEPYRRDGHQDNKLYVAISRLRKMIGDDPEKPRYLFNEPGGGYRLLIDPSDHLL